MASDTLTSSLILIITAIIAFFFWITCLRHPVFLIILTLCIFILNLVFNQEIFSLKVGQYTVYLMDILSIFILSIAIVRSIIYHEKLNYYRLKAIGLNGE